MRKKLILGGLGIGAILTVVLEVLRLLFPKWPW